MPQNSLTMVEKMVDSQADTFSFRDLIAKIFLRPKLFLFALLVPPLIAIIFSALVPVDWAASTKILIRYSSSDNGIFRDLIAEGRLGLSGATSAELIKSTPVLQETIRRVHITGDDIYQSSSDVIKGKISGFIRTILFLKDEPKANGELSDNDALVKSFQASLESTSKKSGKSPSIEVLEKTSQVPESLKLDELITLEVKSFNREKVADMANGLAAAFIDEYYRIYAQEAKKQYDYIDSLVQHEQQEMAAIEKATPEDFAAGKVQPNSSGNELISRDIPILSSMATQLSVLETDLTKAEQIYAAGSPQVRRLKSQVDDLRFMYKKQEHTEISKQLLEQLKAKRYQALNAESLYKNRLVPIGIVEYATTPEPSKAKKIVRVVVSAVIGLILGLMLALGLTIMLNAIDPRIHFQNDVVQLLSVPIVSSIPKIKKNDLTDFKQIYANKALEQDIWQLITRVGQKTQPDQAKIIALTGTIDGDGTSFCALALALSLAKNKNHQVCLVDANFNDTAVSKVFKQQDNGLIDALLGEPYETYFDAHTGLNVLSSGHINKLTALGYYTDMANQVLQTMKTKFDYIVIDTGSSLKSNEALIFSGLADEMLMVASSGVTRKAMLTNAVNKLQNNNANVTGIIFNQSKNVLPTYLYKLI